ncbi:TadE family protein [Paenibacillus sediminis]|uniref:TadE-like domain-containing protein n=1 Tax=Paenibacillus sediminis TaxID=664909 RepID=A0ABS4H5S3_9BACL|nr:TadE family protein [Paenibacillus sediminis]MBP1937435.1 hypothetical protein [Paenibacillus sediminis]
MKKRSILDSEGSFSLEASLVFPIVLLVTFTLLFFCVYMYQNAILVQVASSAAERAAYSWDNSHKDARNGSFAKGEYDSLYWRLSDDQMLGALFGFAGVSSRQSLALPAAASQSGALSVQKIAKAASGIPSGMSGEMSYDHQLMLRKVNVHLEQFVDLPGITQVIGGNMNSEVSSVVTEPVEFIRTVELVRYYGAKFKGQGGPAMNQIDAAAVIRKQAKSN